MRSRRRIEPHRSRATSVAKRVYKELGLAHPTEAPLETLAYVRGALVEYASMTGSRAQLARVGKRSVITVSAALPPEQARFAIAHELGHFEVHTSASYLGICTGKDFVASYKNSGREGEANSFAAELLMPEHLVSSKCDVAKVTWKVVKPIAEEFEVSLTAAAMRFIDLCPEAVALVCSHNGHIEWSSRGKDFWGWIDAGQKLDKWSLAWDYFEKGTLSLHPETVTANAWIANANDELELVEHSISLPSWGRVLSLLWLPPR